MTRALRVIVCGGRDYKAKHRLYEVLDRLQPTVVIHGAHWQGADRYAADWAHDRKVEQIRFEAKWKKLGRKAGPLRNIRMAEEGEPDLVIAFPGGRGTASMVREAWKRGIPVLLADREET